jgi:hypothetical protein
VDALLDLGKEDPVTCIECGVAWDPEPGAEVEAAVPFDAPKKRPRRLRRKTPILLPKSSRSTRTPKKIRTTRSISAATTISAFRVPATTTKRSDRRRTAALAKGRRVS